MALGAGLHLLSCAKYPFTDETLILENIGNFFLHHTLAPKHFNFPALFNLLSAPATANGFLCMKSLGFVVSAREFAHEYFDFASILPILPSRLLSALAGAATILVVFKAGRRFFDPLTASCAAAVLAFSGLHGHYSGYALPDVVATFSTACALYFSLAALATHWPRDSLVAGFFAGLASATKYYAALAIMPVVAVHALGLRARGPVSRPKVWIDGRITFATVAFVAAFFWATPTCLSIRFLISMAFSRMCLRPFRLSAWLACLSASVLPILALGEHPCPVVWAGDDVRAEAPS